MTKMRTLLISAIVAGTMLPVPALAGPEELLTYTVHTVYLTPAGERVVTDTDAVLAVPTAVDVDGAIGPEILVSLTIDAARASLRVARLPGAPASMPLSVEAILADPRRNSDLRVAFGYDALSDRAPDVYSATLGIAGARRVTSFTLDLETVAPGETLGVIAEVFTRGAQGERIDPQRGRVDFTPVPPAAHFGGLTGSDFGITQSTIDLASAIPTAVDVSLVSIEGAREQRATAQIADVPSALTLIMTDAQSGERTWDYTATERVEEIEFSLVNRDGETLLDEFSLRIEDMARSATLIQDTAEHMTFRADAPIGAVDVAIGDGGPARRLDDAGAYVYFDDADGRETFAARVLGLEAFELGTGDPLIVDVTLAGGPFRVVVREGDATIDGWIRDLPSHVRIEISPTEGTVVYTGAAPIGLVELVASDPSGIAGRATKLELTIRDLPTTLNLAFGEDGGRVSLDAGLGTIGLIEVLLTDGPSAALDPATDGVIFTDRPDQYSLFARITGLRRIAVDDGPPTTAELVTSGGRPFLVSLNQQKPSGAVQSLRAEIDALPSSVALTLDEAAGTASYRGSSVIRRLTADVYDPEGISGRATTLHLKMLDLPTTLDIAWGSGGSTVSLDAKGQTLGLFEVQLTSGPDERLPDAVDGILLKDISDRMVLFARVTGLRKVVATGDPVDVTLETTGGRIFVVDLNRLDGGKVEFTRATLDRLPASVRVRLVETGGRTDLVYTASEATNSLSFETNSGDRWKLTASIANPVPRSLSLCQSSNGACTGFQRSAGAGALRFAASEHTTVNVFDCTRPLNSSCARGSASEFTQIDNWRIRFLEMDADADDVGESGYLFMNTTDGAGRHGLSGYLLNIDGNGGFEANFPSGFSAHNRHSSWSWWGLFKDKNGSITCPGGTSLRVRVLGIWIGVTGYLC